MVTAFLEDAYARKGTPMNLNNALRLLSQIPDDATVLDAGGAAAPFPRADYVIDALPFEAAGQGSHANIHQLLRTPPRYSRETWIEWDLCDRRPWPIADKSFDFVVCSHLLEDVRDPIWICSELQRVAKAGYIEVPSRVEEQSKGVENPRHAGYYHHRWLISKTTSELQFRHKPHVLHSVNEAIVARLSPCTRINPEHAIVFLDWDGDFKAREILEFNEAAVIEELCAFAREARRLPDVCVSIRMPLVNRIKRHVFYHRLSRGRR
jgi:hypothetical protein